ADHRLSTPLETSVGTSGWVVTLGVVGTSGVGIAVLQPASAVAATGSEKAAARLFRMFMTDSSVLSRPCNHRIAHQVNRRRRAAHPLPRTDEPRPAARPRHRRVRGPGDRPAGADPRG